MQETERPTRRGGSRDLEGSALPGDGSLGPASSRLSGARSPSPHLTRPHGEERDLRQAQSTNLPAPQGRRVREVRRRGPKKRRVSCHGRGPLAGHAAPHGKRPARRSPVRGAQGRVRGGHSRFLHRLPPLAAGVGDVGAAAVHGAAPPRPASPRAGESRRAGAGRSAAAARGGAGAGPAGAGGGARAPACSGPGRGRARWRRAP